MKPLHAERSSGDEGCSESQRTTFDNDSTLRLTHDLHEIAVMGQCVGRNEIGITDDNDPVEPGVFAITEPDAVGSPVEGKGAGDAG